MGEKVPSNMCAQWRRKSACASTQFDQSICCPDEETLHPWLTKLHLVKSEKSDQTVRMCRLIWIFAGLNCVKVRFSDVQAEI